MSDHYPCLCTRDCANLLSAVTVCVGTGGRSRCWCPEAALCVGVSESDPGVGGGRKTVVEFRRFRTGAAAVR